MNPFFGQVYIATGYLICIIRIRWFALFLNSLLFTKGYRLHHHQPICINPMRRGLSQGASQIAAPPCRRVNTDTSVYELIYCIKGTTFMMHLKVLVNHKLGKTAKSKPAFYVSALFSKPMIQKRIASLQTWSYTILRSCYHLFNRFEPIYG